MELTNFTIALSFLFLPGLICKLLLQKLVYVEKRNSFYFLVNSFVLGFICYFAYALLIFLSIKLHLSKSPFQLNFLNALLVPDYLSGADVQAKINVIIKEIMVVSGLSIIIALVLSAIINKKYFHSFARFIGVTKRIGDPDIWSFVHNSPKDVDWVVVRDIKNNLMYYGWVHAFSDTAKENELLLSNVLVYNNSTGEKLYETPGLYIARNRDELTMEFPGLKNTVEVNKTENNEEIGGSLNG